MIEPSREYDPSYLMHWADYAAKRTIAAHPGVECYTVAAGITPSGVVHAGNFREVITVDLVARALADRGKQVRFIFSWDDFDVFRKVPADLPQREMLEASLRRSIADVPDPFGRADSYASANIAAFEASLAELGIRPEFIRQHRRYRSGAYASGIRQALMHRHEVKRILDARRSEPLGEDWLPLAGFCDACGRDDLDLSWDGEWGVTYKCRSCAHEADVDLRAGGNAKLPWRVDWPMRWGHEQVHFEPGGKDHSSAGGSYETAKELVAEVYGFKGPEYLGYDFVRIKGAGGKISSSSGGTITVAECLEVYEPELLRWLYASYRPNTEFQLSFDLDVIKLYEDYDRQVALAHSPLRGDASDKKRELARRTLHLASVDHHRIEPGSPRETLPSFRAVSMTVQAFDGDLDRTLAYYANSGDCGSDAAQTRLRDRARRAWAWIEKYAPEDFCFRIRSEPKRRELSADERLVLGRLVSLLREQPDLDEAGMVSHMKSITEGSHLTPQQFYPIAYDLLIDRPKGPKLSTLLATMGADRARALLEVSLLPG